MLSSMPVQENCPEFKTMCKTCGYEGHLAKMCRTGGKKEKIVHMVQQAESIEGENQTVDGEYFRTTERMTGFRR
jgi:hypothetical protein